MKLTEQQIQIINKLQDDAVNKWFDSNYIGTIKIPTGLGKTFVVFKSMVRLYNEGKLTENSKILFVAERIKRETTFLDNANEFKKLYDFDIYKTFKINFKVYNSTRKFQNEHFDFVFMDEIHDGFSPKNANLVENNQIDMLIGVTATTKDHIKYKKTTKKEYFEQYCPVIFIITMKAAHDMGLSREIYFYRFNSYLSSAKNLKCGTKDNTWYDSELNSYKYWDSRIAKLFEEKETGYVSNFNLELQRLYMQRKSILWSAPSKAELYLRYIRPRCQGKTLVFANSLDLLQKCQVRYIVSSKNTKKVNQQYIDMFNNDEIDTIGSFRVIEQGENLQFFNNMVLLSYDSNIDQFVQRIGRARMDSERVNIIVNSIYDTSEIGVIDSLIPKLKITKLFEYEIDNR